MFCRSDRGIDGIRDAGARPEKSDHPMMRVFQLTRVLRRTGTGQITRRGENSELKIGDPPRHE